VEIVFTCHVRGILVIKDDFLDGVFTTPETIHPTLIKFYGDSANKTIITLEKLIFTNQSKPEDLTCLGTNFLRFGINYYSIAAV
jgi:hypothetical protein